MIQGKKVAVQASIEGQITKCYVEENQVVQFILWSILVSKWLIRYVGISRMNNLVVKSLISSLVYLISVLLLYKIAFNGLYIRPEALPQENIFDIAFYWKEMKAEWIRHNQFLREGGSTFEQAHYLLKWSLHLFNMMQYLVLGNAILHVRGHIEGISKIKNRVHI